MHRRMSGWEGWGEEREGRNCRRIKLRQKQKKAKCPKRAMRSHCDSLSFRSGGEGKEYVRQIGQGGKSLRDATDRSDLPFPKEMVQREAEGGSVVE